jgi:hypothetical protein
MRPIAAIFLAELEKSEFRIFYLLEITVDDTVYRYTDCDISLTVNGNVFKSKAFSVDTVRYSAETIVDELKISIENLDDLFTLEFVGGTPRGSEVIYSFVLVDSDNQIITETALGSTIISFWEAHGITGEWTPIAEYSANPIVGYWEYNGGTGGIMPAETILAVDDFWEYDAGTGGIQPTS